MAKAKKCKDCGKLDTEVPWVTRKHQNYGARCKACRNTYARSWSSTNRALVNTASKKWKAKNPEKQKAAFDAWYSLNREQTLQKSKARYVENLESNRQVGSKSMRRWRAENPATATARAKAMNL